MSKLYWRQAREDDAQFIGQCMRDVERERLEAAQSKPARLYLQDLHAQAVQSLVIHAGATPVALIGSTATPLAGMRMVWLSLTDRAHFEPDERVMQNVMRVLQGDAHSLIGLVPERDALELIWIKAMGFHLGEAINLVGAPCRPFCWARPGAGPIVQEWLASMSPAGAPPATVH